MIKVRIETHPEFKIVGRKTWIAGTDNEIFGLFWEQCKNDGLLEIYKRIHKNKTNTITNSMAIGVSCVEKDPENRSFYFYIATECDECPVGDELEEYIVPACDWAIFENKGSLPESLIASEMYAFMEWLPHSEFIHANAPEIEVYPPCNEFEGEILNEFWLPIKKKEGTGDI